MKAKLFLTFLLMALCAKGFAQDIIYNLDGGPIQAKVTEITDDDVRYKTFDNLEGPDYRIPVKRVVRIVFQNGTHKDFNTAGVFAVPNEEEDVAPVGPLVYRSGYFYDLRGRLYNKQMRRYLNPTPYEQDFIKGRNQFQWGSGLTVGGATVLLASIAGGAFYAYFKNQLTSATSTSSESGSSSSNFFPVFIAGGAVGAACLGAGIPLWIMGNRKLGAVADNYNREYGSPEESYRPSLQFGGTGNGIGFALRF